MNIFALYCPGIRNCGSGGNAVSSVSGTAAPDVLSFVDGIGGNVEKSGIGGNGGGGGNAPSAAGAPLGAPASAAFTAARASSCVGCGATALGATGAGGCTAAA